MTDTIQTTAATQFISATRIANAWRGHYVRSVYAKVKAATTWQEMEALIDTFYEMPDNKLSWTMCSVWNTLLRCGLKRTNAAKDHDESICKPGCISCAFEFERQQMTYAGDETDYEDDNRRSSYYDEASEDPRDWYWNDGGGYCDW